MKTITIHRLSLQANAPDECANPELAVHEGLSPEDFGKHFELRFNWWHDYLLRLAEDVAPDVAARIDNRSLSDAGVPPSYPPLFSPPPPEGN